MVRHRNWRIIAVVIIALFFALMLNSLLQSSKAKLSHIYTGEVAYYSAEMLAQIYSQISETDSEGEIQSVISGLRARFPEIETAAVVDGRRFTAHSQVDMIGEKITKDIFDAQRELKKNVRETTTDKPYFSWQKSETEAGVYNIYYPIEIDGEVTGIIYLAIANQQLMPVKIAFPLLFVIMAIFAILILLIDRYIPKFSFIPGIVIFILVLILILNIMEAKFENNLNTWNNNLNSKFEQIDSDMGQLGYNYSTEIDEVELPLQESISNWKLSLAFLGFLFLLFVLTGAMEKFFDTLMAHKLAYLYILPAMFGVFLLVFFPFIYGFLIGFTDYNLTNFGGDLIEYFSNFKNYGFDNFVNILKVINFKEYDNFYFTLAHTIIWTVLNLTFHVGIGVILALILNDPKLKGRTFFRIILILPWAIPNYITALIWRGMFHKQFGAVNGLLELLGFEPISWFTAPVTAFLANLATNVWLGFPFMMIIALGALQSIPKELYEASAIDGSSKWQSFWNVTFPLLKPAMVPAIILGTIWTFNQFNVIYLVSGGGPDGATELLITDAYKLAFEQYRYGYAAAYCIIIFLVLLTYGIVTSKVTRATKGVYE